MSHSPLDSRDLFPTSRREDHLSPGNLSVIPFHASALCLTRLFDEPLVD
jgi:hypothetical protein